VKEFVPAPTFGDQSQNNYQDNRAQRLNNDQFTVRVDRNMGNKNFYARYSLSSERGFTPEKPPRLRGLP
jgi:hypothetical protein